MDEQLDIYFNGNDWVVSYNQEDAITTWNEHVGDDYVKDGYGMAEDWDRVRCDDFIIVYEDNPEEVRGVPEGALVEYVDGLWTVTASTEQWIAHNGRGWLCSLDW